MADIYVAKSDEGYWMTYVSASDSWRPSSISDLLNATHAFDRKTNSYNEVSFRVDALNRRPECPIDWDPISQQWKFQDFADPYNILHKVSAPGTIHQDKETLLSQITEDLRAEVSEKLKNQLAASVRDELYRDLKDSVKAEIERKISRSLHASVYDELCVKLKPPVIKALRKELSKSVRLELEQELRADISREIRPRIRAKIKEELQTKVTLSQKEISSTKKELLKQVALTPDEVKQHKELLKDRIEGEVREEIEKIRQRVLKEIGYEKIQQFRKTVVDENRDAVIADLYRTSRPIIEGSLRKELTLKNLRAIMGASGSADLSDVARQVEHSLREELAEEVRKQEFQNALFHICDLVGEMHLDESVKEDLQARIRNEVLSSSAKKNSVP